MYRFFSRFLNKSISNSPENQSAPPDQSIAFKKQHRFFSQKALFIVLPLLAIFLIAGDIFLYRSSAKPSQVLLTVTSPSPATQPTINVDSQTSKLAGALNMPATSTDINVLLLGYGGAGHDGAYLTDSMTLLNYKPDKRTLNIISVPRDLFVSIPVDWDYAKDSKINAAYAIGIDDTTYPNKRTQFRGRLGGGSLAKYVVSQVTGLPINYFISVDFSKFTDGIDLLGGITINNPFTFEDDFYPVKGLENETCGFTADQINQLKAQYSGFNLEKQFTCRYEKLQFTKGPVQLDGTTALKYVRSRHSATYGGDFDRSMRQHAVLEGIAQKVISLSILDKANPLFQKLVGSVTTDITASNIASFLSTWGNPTDVKTNQIYLTDQNVLINAVGPGGAYILIPKAGKGNYTDLQKYIKDNSI